MSFRSDEAGVMATTVDYRGMARDHAKRAADLLALPDTSVVYIAAELRMAIEAIAYGRLQDYIDDIPPRRLNEWQAPKILEAVTSIDPGVACTRRLMVEVDADNDEKVWVLLGEDNALSMKSLQGNYHALGNFLHTPTIGQLSSGKAINAHKQIAKCRAILDEIDSVTAIENWSFSLSIPYEFQCMREGCSSKIKRRMNELSMQPETRAYSSVVECFECAATYDVVKDGKNTVCINPQLTNAKCQNNDCGHRLQIWHSDVRRREDVSCPGCGARSNIVLGISPA